MKIKKLKLLTPFRGLPAGYEISFENNQINKSVGVMPICFVGLNGSGKSNVLEVIAEIFYFMEIYHRASKDTLASFASSFGFEIEYEMPNYYILSGRPAWDDLNRFLSETSENPLIRIVKKINERPVISAQLGDVSLPLKNSDGDRNGVVLPSRIVGYSSGMNELLSNPFIKMDFNYYDDFKTKSGIEALNMNRMFFMNYDSNKFIAISNFMFDSESYAIDMDEQNERAKALGMAPFGKDLESIYLSGINLKTIKKELRVQGLRSFVISLKLRKYKNEKDFLNPTLRIALEDLKKCATFINEHKRETKIEDYLETELTYWVNRSTQKAFQHYFKTSQNLFQIFYYFQLLNYELITTETRKNIVAAKSGSYENLSEELPKHEASNLVFRISSVTFSKNDKSRLHYRKLSDGEHQLLQVFGSLMLMDAPGSLILLDEPDTHFNPDWRSKFVSMLNESIGQEREQEVMLTTHSPYIVSDCKKENVYIFQRNADGTVCQPRMPSINTFGTSISIIADAVFGKEDTISELSKKKIDEIREMPLDTIENIQAAKEASRVLGESVEKVLLFKEIISKQSEIKND